MQYKGQRLTTLRRGKILSVMIGLFLGFGIMSVYAQNCTQWSGGTINSGQTVYGYSTILRSNTGQNYGSGCSPFSGALTCSNGLIQGNYQYYKYTINQCSAGTPHSCYFTGGNGLLQTLVHGYSGTRYSTTGIAFPQNCSNVAATLNCFNGNIIGNYQTYNYPTCTPQNQLVNGVDLSLSGSLGLPGGATVVAQGTSPIFSLNIKNNGDHIAAGVNVPAGFISCMWTDQNISVYSSPIISAFVVNTGTQKAIVIQLSNLFTQSITPATKQISCSIHPSMLTGVTDNYPANNTRSTSIQVQVASRFDLAMENSITSIKTNLEPAEAAVGANGIQNFVFEKVMAILVPLVVVIGILLALLGFYKLMFSTEEKAVSDGTKYVIYGLLGVIIMMSAKYIGSAIFTIITNSTDIKGFQVAQSLYDKIFFPFIKIAVYVVLGAMFVILVSRVITLLFGTDADARKKAGTIIGWNVLGMLVIIGAKQIVEAVYGKYAAVVQDTSNLGQIGTGILADKNIPLIYQVINRALGLASLVVLIVIIVQTIKLLMKPDDPKQLTSIKTSLIYIFIGILVIGAGYLIVNFLIVN